MYPLLELPTKVCVQETEIPSGSREIVGSYVAVYAGWSKKWDESLRTLRLSIHSQLIKSSSMWEVDEGRSRYRGACSASKGLL